MAVDRRGYYVFLAGGTGSGSGEDLHHLFLRMAKPFPLRLHAIDSDPLGKQSCPFDCFTHIGLTPAEVDCLRANIRQFGKAAEAIDQLFAPFLHREQVAAGSRARRALTQLFVAFHQRKLIEDIRQQVMGLMSAGDIDQIQPILVASSGGGCGSPLAILLALLLHDPATRSIILAGYHDSVLRLPIIFAADPYAKAERNNEIQQSLIYANSFAFREEAGWAQDREQLADVYLSGLSNGRGVVLRTVAQLHRHLGTIVFWHMVHEQLVASIKANHGFTKYGGVDVPELAYPDPTAVELPETRGGIG